MIKYRLPLTEQQTCARVVNGGGPTPELEKVKASRAPWSVRMVQSHFTANLVSSDG